MLKMNLITQKELYGELDRELYRELDREVYMKLGWELCGDLYGEVHRPLVFQIRADFSHYKISRV